MRTKYIFLVVLVLHSFRGTAQFFQLGKTIYTGFSASYIPFKEEYSPTYHEGTFTFQSSVSISKSLFLGVQVYEILTKVQSKSTNYNLFGIKASYDFLPNKKHHLFIETSFNKGNYCTAGFGNPYKKSNLNYIGYGLEFDFNLAKSRFYLIGGLMFHTILNREIENKSNFNIYKIGMNYRIGKIVE